MVERRSLAFVIFMSAAALLVGSLLYQMLDPAVGTFTNRSSYGNATGYESPVGGSIADGQRWVSRLWTLSPVILILAVGTTLIIASRRGRGSK